MAWFNATPKVKTHCLFCGAEINTTENKIKKGRGRYCSLSCSAKGNGGKKRIIKTNGYAYIKKHDHPNKTTQNLVPEHRWVMEQYLGRYLEKHEIVHHLDGDKLNNDISNLYLCQSVKEHKAFHRGTSSTRKRLRIEARKRDGGESFVFDSLRDAVRELKISPNSIRMALTYKCYYPMGYEFKKVA